MIRALRAPVFGLVISLLVGALVLICVGERPTVLVEALSNTLFTSFGLGYTLFYATPLILTGLSVAVAFHCGLFNIGAEGQLYFGSLGVVVIATLFPSVPRPIALLMGIGAAALSGGLWGGIAGLLKARRGSHEVIVTILLNFIAYSIVDYAILYLFKNPEVQNPETIAIGARYQLSSFAWLSESVGLEIFRSTPVNTALLLAVGLALATQFLLFRTVPGLELRAVGLNPGASRFAGISVPKNMTLAFCLSGALAGLVGVNQVMGHEHKLAEGFSPGYGFTGIAVALLARNHPIGILGSAILFGALQNSSRELEFLSEKVTKELALVLQGTLIAFIAADYLIEKGIARLKRLR